MKIENLSTHEKRALEELLAGGIPEVDADDVIARRSLGASLSEFNPHTVAGPERSSGFTFGPHPNAENPLIEAADSNEASDFVADPFVRYDDEAGEFVMLYESMVTATGDGVITRMTSKDGFSWGNATTVLEDAGVHLSFPYFFKDKGTWYLTPANSAGELRIYESDDTVNWTLKAVPETGNFDGDKVLFRWGGKWYLVIGTGPDHDETSLFYADELTGSYTEHPASPLWGTQANSAPGGRPVVQESHIDLFIRSQGNHVKHHVISELSPTSITVDEATDSPVVRNTANGEWNDSGMHHIDWVHPDGPASPLLIVDGLAADGTTWSIGAYSQLARPDTRMWTRLEQSATQAVASGGYATANLDATGWDLGGDADTVAYTVTVPEDGYYEVNFGTAWGGIAGSPAEVQTRVRDSGTATTYALAVDHIAYNSGIRQSKTTREYLTAGTALELQVYQNTGASADVTAHAGDTYLEVRRLR